MWCSNSNIVAKILNNRLDNLGLPTDITISGIPYQAQWLGNLMMIVTAAINSNLSITKKSV